MLKGKSGKKLDLPKEAKILPSFKKQIIKDEYKYQDANIDLNEINVTIQATQG